ncbi:MAG: leucine-rich repeat domain-containing protein [Treponema sp.]|nr:leucine-rich repeat domain-containing protein [Treponema sp.]
MSVDLSASLGTIGNNAFQGCAALESVISRNPVPPSLALNAFTGCTSLTEIKVPAASVIAYQGAAGIRANPWTFYQAGDR